MVKVNDLIAASVPDDNEDGSFAALDGISNECWDPRIQCLLRHFVRFYRVLSGVGSLSAEVGDENFGICV